MTERANIKQPTVNDGYSKLRGRICTVILTSTHQWNLWAQGGQLLRMSVPLSIFIFPRPPSPCFVTLLFHLHTTRAAFWCLVSSCPKAVEVSLTDIWYLFHFCYSNSLRGPGVCLFTAAVPDVFVSSQEDYFAFEAVNQTKSLRFREH